MALFVDGKPVDAWVLDVGPMEWPLLPKLAKAWEWTDSVLRRSHVAGELIEAVVEDMPPKPPYLKTAWMACRLQGVILFALYKRGVTVGMVQAREWQHGLGYRRTDEKKKGFTTKGWAANRCAELGLMVPAYVQKKAVEDVRDTLLIGTYWLQKDAVE